jgi:hypothetical protein
VTSTSNATIAQNEYIELVVMIASLVPAAGNLC